MVRRPGHPPPPAGFTLIEVLVGLALVGVLAALLSRSLRVEVAALEQVRIQATGVLNQAAARSLLRDLLERAQPLAGGLATPDGTVALAGTARSLAFVAVADGPDGDGALYRFLVHEAEGALVLDRCLAAGMGAAATRGCAGATVRTVLARPANALALAYYGARTPQDAPAWRPDWTAATALPRLIRLSFGGEPLLAAPRIAARRGGPG